MNTELSDKERALRARYAELLDQLNASTIIDIELASREVQMASQIGVSSRIIADAGYDFLTGQSLPASGTSTGRLTAIRLALASLDKEIVTTEEPSQDLCMKLAIHELLLARQLGVQSIVGERLADRRDQSSFTSATSQEGAQ